MDVDFLSMALIIGVILRVDPVRFCAGWGYVGVE